MPVSVVYDAIAPRYACHRGALDFAVDVLRRLHGQSPGGPVLEVGCGTGDYVTAIAKTGSCKGFGMDPSRQMLERAPIYERISYLQGRAASLPFADQSIDMIFSVNVVHHLEDIEHYFRESLRIVNPGGIVCTATDSDAIIKRRRPLSQYWPSTVPVELARYHDIDALRERMAAAGICRIGQCEGRSDFPIPDIGPYRDKAFSCLELIPEEAFARGLLAMESDLRTGPLEGTSELVFLWGERR